MKNTYLVGLLLIGVVIVIVAASLGGKASVTVLEPPTTPTDDTNNGQETAEDNQEAQAHPVTVVQTDDYINGNPEAAITWIEFGDFDCPFCRKLHPELEQMIETYPDDVKWVFRHFPLPSHGQIAFDKSHAAECVGELGGNEAFWAFNDALYNAQGSVRNLAGVKSLALEQGVDGDGYQTCMDSDRYVEKIQAQIDIAASEGVRGTPGGIVVVPDGQAFLVGGALSFSQIQEIIEDVMN